MISNSGQLVRAMRAIVSYHRSCGVAGYACSAETLSACKRLAAEGADTPQAPGTAERLRQPAVLPDEKPPLSSATALDQVQEEVAVCRMCQLHRQRVQAVPGAGGYRPKLLMVGEWPIVSGEAADDPTPLFGTEEDLMLERIKGALGLSPQQVYVTSVIKCGVPATVRPSPEQAKTCASYLRRQVEALAPETICAMGTFAAQVLTGIERPLSMLRGRLFPCRLTDKREISVVSTYHPTFLLQNPDMKHAAWQDLQVIMKRLGLPRQ